MFAFFTPFINHEGDLELDPSLIFRHQVKKGLVIDFVALIPFSLLTSKLALLDSIKILRFRKVWKLTRMVNCSLQVKISLHLAF